jgi:hypothetical protein
MFKARVALLGVLALFIASGIAAPTASAGQGPFWHVGGTKLGQGEVKQFKAQAKGVTVLKAPVPEHEVEIKCHNSYSEGAAIIGQGNFQGQDKGRIVFEQCETFIYGVAGSCKVISPIKTNQLKSYLAYNGEKPEVKQQKFVNVFEPQQGENFVVLKFEGGKACPAETAPVTGSVAAEIVPIERESQELLFAFPVEPITHIVHEQQERKVGLTFIVSAVFSGAFGVRLVDNQPWGVFGQ